MSDRLDRAHALRAAIHRWLKRNPHAGMAAITAAFPDVPAVTVRKSVQRLSGLGSVARHGASTATTYTALGEEIYRPETMRQDVPGKYVNRPDMHHPHPYQGGQFDRSGRLNGVSLLAMAG